MAESDATEPQNAGGHSPVQKGNVVTTFIAQVLDELRKLVQPTRKELLTYTVVVIIFVLVMMAYVFGLDRLFDWLIELVLGSGGV